MVINTGKTLVIALFALLASGDLRVAAQEIPKGDFHAISRQLLKNIIEGKDTRQLEDALANTTPEALKKGLATDRQKVAFWVNIYNAYIQLILSENPGLYKDRSEFFKKEQIPIAGTMLSFAKIEHGILRKSQWELGLGYFRKWFPDELERDLRVENPDYRIHFALNCGAQSCPPVAIYQPERLDEQFDMATRNYLQSTSTFNKEKGEVAVTALFNWFRGDFDGTSGIRKILGKFDVIPTGMDVELTYKEYDWTLRLNNFTTL